MPRRKAAPNVAITPWLSAKNDCREGRFIQVGNSLMLSKSFQELSVGARWLYLSMALESGGKWQFTFTHGAAKKYGIARTSFDRYAVELISERFIERVEDENQAQYAPAVYRFSLKWKNAKGAPKNGEP